MVHTQFAFSMLNMIEYTVVERPPRLGALVVQGYSSSVLTQSREILAHFAIEAGATHTLWIDSDMQFPQEMIVHFCTNDYPLLGINATARRPPYRNCAQVEKGVELESLVDSTGQVPVFRMGFGVAWIQTAVFKAMEKPWFDFVWLPDKGVFQGEDHYFVMNATKLGYEPRVDQDVTRYVQHLGIMGYNPVAKAMMPKDIQEELKQ